MLTSICYSQAYNLNMLMGLWWHLIMVLIWISLIYFAFGLNTKKKKKYPKQGTIFFSPLLSSESFTV